MHLLPPQPSAPRDLAVWQHALACLQAQAPATLLLVVQSSGSSPGRQGFKMSVGPTSMAGSVGGGIMEHKFVELARTQMQRNEAAVLLREQVHRSEAAHNRSGMICSGQQTLLLLPLHAGHLELVQTIVAALQQHQPATFSINQAGELAVKLGAPQPVSGFGLSSEAAGQWQYTEALGFRDRLTIVGAGHVALALSRIVATLDFHLTVLDDRPELNTLLQNPYAHEKRALQYEHLREQIPEGPHQYVAIMTFGYRTDDVAVRQLLGRRFAYLGLLGSEAKIARLLAGLRADGFSEAEINQLYTPIGLPIHSRTPEEIAISIAAEIIRVRNAPLATR